MPSIFNAFGYSVYFWINEGNPLEPIHIHVSKGSPNSNAPKFWLTTSGAFIPDRTDYNNFRDLQRVVEKFVNQGGVDILKNEWLLRFNLSDAEIKYFKG